MKVAIISGSVYGRAEDVARHALGLLRQTGLDVQYLPRAGLADLLASNPEAVLVVTSSTGDGELPDDLLPLYQALRDQLPQQFRGMPGAILALGDSSYSTYCGGGELISELFAELGVEEIVPMLRLDGSETVDQETDAEPWLAELVTAWKGK